MSKIYNILLLIFLAQISFGQLHQDVFPTLSGQNLFDSLVVHYKPDSVLVWGDAKDTIFAVIDNVNDTVVCVYTGLEKWLDPSQDPSDYMAMNNDPNGMNIEHTYPQSKGAASGNARADMHHLFPARNETNNMRGNLPFDELNDSLVTNWFVTTFNAQGIPSFNIDAYSELILNQAFEPREDWKGNVARAMFYFYTIYRNEANGVDPNYFNLQKEVLCDWHLQDPVDQIEWDRTYKVASYQEGKPNPFVLDCSLAKRMYCPNQSSNCISTAVESSETFNSFVLEALYPNPTSQNLNLNYRLERKTQLNIELYNALGQQVSRILNEEQDPSSYQLNINAQNIEISGFYFLKITFENELERGTKIHKIFWNK
jgi:hypothetical protein